MQDYINKILWAAQQLKSICMAFFRRMSRCDFISGFTGTLQTSNNGAGRLRVQGQRRPRQNKARSGSEVERGHKWCQLQVLSARDFSAEAHISGFAI